MKNEYRTLDELILEDLKNDPEACDLYLESALEEYKENSNIQVLLSALRHISEAKGITKVAKEAGLSRETFYKSLSPTGNPRLETLFKILKAFHYEAGFVFRKMA
jgi:probable addiction module antidote protein